MVELCQCHKKMSRVSIRSSLHHHGHPLCQPCPIGDLQREQSMFLCTQIGYTLADFAENTSAHGIPRAYTSRGRLRRALWLLLFLGCFIAFSGQAFQIVQRFFRNDIIVGVELKFENIPFPSVTVCNLNPYKNSLAREMAAVGDTLLAYDSAMAASFNNFIPFPPRVKRQNVAPSQLSNGSIGEQLQGTSTGDGHGRKRVLSRYEGLLAVFSFCECQPQSLMGCQALKDRQWHGGSNGTLSSSSSSRSAPLLCLCFYNPQNEQVWPCFEPENWRESRCRGCTSLGNCDYEEVAEENNNKSSDTKITDQYAANEPKKWPCLCAPAIRICVRLAEKQNDVGGTAENDKLNQDKNAPEKANQAPPSLMDRVPKIWELKRAGVIGFDETEEQRKAKEQAYGLKGVSDPIAIRAKAVENLVFAVSQLNDYEKQQMGYSKREFITKCSFNGRECSVEEDFSLYVDPTFGNCFTFNAHSWRNVRSERAGPNYGLRFQVFVNVSDYLPTTEAAGVRITVHSPEEQPFPDTHGHSAPTGFVSSFGIRLKRVHRLPAPYGECVEHGKTDEYIYRDKEYSTEGCQRSCIQRMLVRECGCGDPRFPRYLNYSNCPVGNPKLRECLRREMRSAARSATHQDCICRQPCREQVYSITYSCARWPSSDLVLRSHGDCDPELSGAQCLQFQREQSAIVEVYFEQLNYESLHESEAYGLPNLLSDFGGQLGLWMGVSVITIMELVILVTELLIRFVLFPCANFLRQWFESAADAIEPASFERPERIDLNGRKPITDKEKKRRVLVHKGSFIRWIDEDDDILELSNCTAAGNSADRRYLDYRTQQKQQDQQRGENNEKNGANNGKHYSTIDEEED